MKTFAELSMDFLFDTSFYCRFCNFIIIKGAGDFSSVSNFYRISSWFNPFSGKCEEMENKPLKRRH